MAARPTQMWFADVADGHVYKTLSFAAPLTQARAGLAPSLIIPIVERAILKRPNRHIYRQFNNNDDGRREYKDSVSNEGDAHTTGTIDDMLHKSTDGPIVGGQENGVCNGDTPREKGNRRGGGGAGKKFEFGPLTPFMDGGVAVSWSDDSVAIVDVNNKELSG